MLLAVLGIVAGLAVLTVAADHFVIGAARLARRLEVSTIVVGAVVIGFGTSAPELLVSGLAGAQGALDLAVGNIVGSNVANLTLVLGVAALITPIVVQSPALRREAPLSLFAVVAFGIAVQGGVTVWEGLALATILVVSLTVIVTNSRGGDDPIAAEVSEFLTASPVMVRREVLRTGVGLLATLGGAQLLVVSATHAAELLGWSESFIGLTVVAVGTSLPELATAVQAARKQETGLIVGNLLGSNLFNAAGVGATAAFAGAGQVAGATITGLGVWLMIGVATVATAFMVTGRRVMAWEGAVLLVFYAATVPLLFG